MTPLIRANDYTVLDPPELGSWTPGLTVSVVVPAYNGHDKLDLVLAGLAVQSYPAGLMDVVVVDNGSSPPLRLPELRPRRTRLVVCDTPGRADARNAGLAAAEGEVVHWLDSDVVPDRHEVEAHMRWHHLAPYLVVTGYLRFTARTPPGPEAVAEAADLAELFEPAEPHEWLVDLVERTNGLTRAANRAFSLHVGGATSVSRRLLDDAGPMDEDLVLGQDTEMGYRLAQAGAVFVPEPRARGYHLGPSMRMRDKQLIDRVSHATIGDRVPQYRWLRTHPTRQWKVPYLEVVVEAAGYEDTRATVDAVLAGTVPDVSVLLVGPWDTLVPERRAPLKDPHLDLTLIHAHYAHEGRVRATPAETGRLAPFRLRLPAGWVPGEDTLARLLDLAVDGEHGLVEVLLAEGAGGVVAARLERRAAFARAALVAGRGDTLDDVVDDVYGSLWTDGETWGFVPASEAAPGKGRRAAYRARLETEAEVVRLTKEAERLRGQVAKWREESGRWRKSAVDLRREVGTLRREVAALKAGRLRAAIKKISARRARPPGADGEPVAPGTESP
ncbi:glycosyltransferase family 2 protein [Sphaerisporangium sp. TRM90804]|uniref:glycosyltransferase family 2 protein n=1 Tax=Sphaerisporangium sp. TRM90804 TaxID=3031113 RepID=UPI00244A0096|nr:glycosyltransferase family 2 protein [Sphaerisporangium sp. TRM90804]MDH2428105.1 glycosyltransferase [Sphaerisporangium sp. TRM90804]